VAVYSTKPSSEGNTVPLTAISEEWFAPDLQIRMLATTDDPRYGLMIDKFEDFSRSEPDAKLFEPPPGFRILDETGSFYVTWAGV